MSDVLTVLSSLRESVDDDLVPVFFQLEDQWDRKLWHQLTQTLAELYRDPRSAPIQVALFERFISRFESSLNPLAFASFAVASSEQFATAEESLTFMKGVAAKTGKSDDARVREVHVFVELRLASLYIQLNQIVPAKKIMDASKATVDELLISDQAILVQYYGVACEYYKHQADYSQYYRYALLYLAVLDTSLASMDPKQQQQRAHDLCIAALLADKIFNFGELILHPVLRSLQTPEYQWLADLVSCVNAGDVLKFQQLRPMFTERSPLLASALPFLEQKICLMALCECVFRRQATERTISFTSIARETHLQAGAKVEVLVMKAFSLGLMRGLIDEVAKTVSVSWLQPRALSLDQMRTMRGRLDQWDSDVKRLGEFMATHGEDVWQAA